MERRYTTKNSIYIQDTKVGKWTKKHEGKITKLENAVYISHQRYNDLAEGYGPFADVEGNFDLNMKKDFFEEAGEEDFRKIEGVVVYAVHSGEDRYRIWHSGLVKKIEPPFGEEYKIDA